MSSKGRKSRVAAASTGLQDVVKPKRVIPPFTPLDCPNGANMREMLYYKIFGQISDAEVYAWRASAAHKIGVAMSSEPRTNPYAGHYAGLVTKELPAVITFLPADPEESWPTATSWLATTKAPKYTDGQLRELDGEYASEGATPLLALLALLDNRVERKIWAWEPKAIASPRFYHYETVYPNG